MVSFPSEYILRDTALFDSRRKGKGTVVYVRMHTVRADPNHTISRRRGREKPRGRIPYRYDRNVRACVRVCNARVCVRI